MPPLDLRDFDYLDFKPRRHAFSKAQVMWQGILLNAQKTKPRTQIDLSDEDPSEVLCDLFGHLDFIELAELVSSTSKHPQLKAALDWNAIFRFNQMQWNDRVQNLILKTEALTISFRDWCFAKKISVQDLMPILSLKDLESFNELSSEFDRQQLSRNDGKKVIDLLVDLIMMGHSVDSLRPLDGNSWTQHLHNQRYPMTTEKDQIKSPQNQWPRYVQVSKSRQGDRLIYKMQISYSDDRDLNQKLKRLSQMENQHE